MLPTRAWELLLGSLLAFIEWTPKSQKGKCLCFLVGLILLIYSIFFFENKIFPGFWAIFPYIGTFLYIAGETNLQSSFIKLFTENKIFVFIGVVSYSFLVLL